MTGSESSVSGGFTRVWAGRIAGVLVCGVLGIAMVVLWRGVPQAVPERAPVASTRPAGPTVVATGAAEGPQLAQDPGPTLLTLNLKGVPGDEALTELAKQSGYMVEPIAASMRAAMKSRPVTLSAAGRPFWPVLLELCGVLGVYPYPSSENRSAIYLSASAADRLKCPRVEAGSCVVTLHSITTTASVDPSGMRPMQREIMLRLSLLIEPKLKVFSLPYYAAVEQAVDDKGQSMVPEDSRAPGDGGAGGPWTAPIYARLTCPENPGSRIARIKGYASLMLYDGMESWEITDVLRARRRSATLSGANVEFRGLERTFVNYTAYFAVGAGQQEPPSAAPFLSPLRTVRLLNAQGEEFAPAKITVPEGRARGVFIHASFPRTASLGEPHKIILSVPAGLKELRVPFEFTDLPLP